MMSLTSVITPRFVSLRKVTNCFSCMSIISRAASGRSGETVMNVFDRNAKRLHRDRTTVLEDYKVYEYIKEEFGYRLSDRVLDIKREFDHLVDLGCGRGYVSKHLLKDSVKQIYQCEFSEKMLRQSEVSPEVPTQKLVVDEEFLPFKDNSLDIVISGLSLHWVNDLPGCFRQINNALKQDGVFLGCMFGGDTLYELRVALQLAEQELEGGLAAHVSPFTSVQDLGNLLNRAGFTMLTLDIDEMVITYPSIKEVMWDLKGMAENNCAWSRKPLKRKVIEAADAKYKEMYQNDQGVPATFQVIYWIGWKPHPSQPKPAQRGSGQFSLKDLGNLDQIAKELNLDSTTKTDGSDSSDKNDPNKS